VQTLQALLEITNLNTAGRCLNRGFIDSPPYAARLSTKKTKFGLEMAPRSMMLLANIGRVSNCGTERVKEMEER
jgi:hypothetical protein